MNPVELALGHIVALSRTQTPRPLLTGSGRPCGFNPADTAAPSFTTGLAIGIEDIVLGDHATLFHMEGLEPWRRAMVTGKGRTFAKVRLQRRPREFAGLWIERNLPSIAGTHLDPHMLVRRRIFRRLLNGFPLGHRQLTFPGPVQDRCVVGHDLAFPVSRVAGLSLLRQHRGHPIFDRDLRGIGTPVCLLLRDGELLAEPVDGLADQLGRIDRFLHPAFTIRQLRQRLHDVLLKARGLQGVVDAPVTPHA